MKSLIILTSIFGSYLDKDWEFTFTAQGCREGVRGVTVSAWNGTKKFLILGFKFAGLWGPKVLGP
jgi:hypothetical protein